MAAADAAKTERDSFEDSVFSNSLFCISGTVGVEPTSARQKGRHRAAISGEQQKQERAYHGIMPRGVATDD